MQETGPTTDETTPEETPPQGRFAAISFLAGFGLGIFLGVALAILAIALVTDQQDTATADNIIFPTVQTVTGILTPTPDVRPRTRTQLDVRLGPGAAFAIVGLLSRDEMVEVVGRDNSAEWVAIRFPPGSAARGWVPVSALEGLTEPDAFAVVLPTPLARTITEAPSFSGVEPSGNDGRPAAPTSSAPNSGGGSVPNGTAAPISGQAIDLVLNRISLLADGRVSVVVGNRGPGDIADQIIMVSVRDLGSRSEQLLSARDLPVGATVTLQTQSFVINQETEVFAIADPSATLRDSNRSNNTLSALLSPPIPTPTPTPND
jgi:hypothetical protein